MLFFKNEAYCKGEYFVKKWSLWNGFLFCCDVLGVTCHLDFTKKENICMSWLENWNFSFLKKFTLYFAKVWTHDTCKCVEKKGISPWTPLSMVSLSITFMALSLTNKDLCDSTNSSICGFKYECLKCKLSVVKICLCVVFQDYLLMN